MAVKSKLPGYWERLEPIEELTYEDGRFEIRVFDDRDEDDMIYVQFAKTGGRGRKVATLQAGSIETIDELIADLKDVRKGLGG